jgi:hypothetical protein
VQTRQSQALPRRRQAAQEPARHRRADTLILLGEARQQCRATSDQSLDLGWIEPSASLMRPVEQQRHQR